MAEKVIKRIGLGLLVAVLSLTVGFGSAYAADITYSVDTTVDLSSPDINLTILADSVATSTVINAGTVVVTVPVSSTFTITSADRLLVATGETQFGVITTTCSSALLSKMIITAPSGSAQTITVTPSGSACSPGPSGGGGGGGSYTPPATPAVPAVPAVPATPAVPTVTPAVPATPATPATPASSFNFGTKTLKNGSKGEPVKELQRFLNQVLKLGLVIDGKLGPKQLLLLKNGKKLTA